MKDHALIGKFMGIWPSEKALQIWIKSHWKVKGQIDLQLGSKGFLQSYSWKQGIGTKSLKKVCISSIRSDAHEILDGEIFTRERIFHNNTSVDQMYSLHKNYGTSKPWRESETHWDPSSKSQKSPNLASTSLMLEFVYT
jgi:hypothetical protein